MYFSIASQVEDSWGLTSVVVNYPLSLYSWGTEDGVHSPSAVYSN